MILSPQQNDKFYLIFDTLTAYANERLGVTDKMLVGDPEMIDSYEQSRVAVELWKNKAVIDEFLTLPDTMLRRDELDIVRTWKSALIGTFLVMNMADGHSYFIVDGYAFDVYGITRDVAEVIPNAPTYVRAALLPFEGHIIYGGYLIEDPMPAMTSGSPLNLLKDLEQLRSAGHVIASSEDFLSVYPVLEELRVQREVDSMMRDLGTLGEEHGIEGTHRGVLAGVAGDERKAARLKAARTNVGSWFNLEGYLRGQCVKAEPDVSLHELVATMGIETQRDCAIQLGVSGIRALSHEELVDALCVAYAQNVDSLEYELCFGPGLCAEFAKKTFEAGGRLVLGKDKLLAQDFLGLSRMPYFVFVDLGQDRFAYVIPQELMPVFSQVDWDYVEQRRGFRKAVVTVCEGLVELRGIVELRDAVEQFRSLYPEFSQFDDNDVLNVMRINAGSGRSHFDLLQSVASRYVVNVDLAMDYYDAYGRAQLIRPPFTDGMFLQVALTEVLFDILQRRRGKPRRKLTREMLAGRGVREWELGLSPVRALRNFLDENVPDGQDDYSFADEVISELVNMAHGGFALQDCVDFLHQQSFQVDEPHVKEFAGLMMHMINNVPSWGNNGWSFNELSEANTGFRVFYNEDGTPMNLSGDDPCPCGSGKKYGQCHGKINPGMLDLGLLGLNPLDL